jgi:hypothetical protein
VVANGQSLSRTTYSKLWAEAQASGLLTDETTKNDGDHYFYYGGGDETTTFSVPMLLNYFIRCNVINVGHTYPDQIKVHEHKYTRPTITGHGNEIDEGKLVDPHVMVDTTYSDSSLGGLQATGTETNPKYGNLLPCIYTGV